MRSITVTLLVLLGASRLSSAQCPNDSTGTNADVSHPRYYTRISEIGSDGRLYPIVWQPMRLRTGQDAEESPPLDPSLAEVDVDSKIQISFDKVWMDDHCVEGSIMVEGQVENAGQSTPFEIPGYSLIGKPAVAASVSVRSGLVLLNEIRELSRTWQDVRSRLDSADLAILTRRNADSARVAITASALRTQIDARRQVQARLDSLTSIMIVKVASRDSLRRRAADTLAPQLAGLDTTIDSLAKGAKNAAESIRDIGSELDQYVATNASYRAIRDSNPVAFAGRARQILITVRPILRTSLQELVAPEDTMKLLILARGAGRDALVLRAVIEDLQKRVLPIVFDESTSFDGAAGAAPARRFLAALDDLRRDMSQLAALSPAYCGMPGETGGVDGRYLRLALLAGLRETQFSVASTRAHVGDAIVVTVRNVNGNADRELSVRLRVRELGFVAHVTDAVMLVKRTGINRAAQQKEIQDGRAQYVSSGVSPEIRQPADANFIAAAGGQLVWTYHARRTSHGSRWTSIVRWLSPGIGLNVSFTTFHTKVVTFSSPPPDGSAGSGVLVNSTLDDSPLQIATGPVVTLFDGKLSFGVGWNLNVPEKRRYAAIGLSFINILGKLGANGGAGGNTPSAR